MKIFKIILILTTLSTSTIILPKIVSKTTAVQQPKPTPIYVETPTYTEAPLIRVPGTGAPQIPSKKTFAQLAKAVKDDKTAWDKTGKLNAQFVRKITEAAIASELEDYQLDLLLQMARDYHAQFTGNAATDIKILNDLKEQRNTIIDQYKRD